MYKIYLSPSTQEANIGVSDYGSEEMQMNLLCIKISQLLKRNNYGIVVLKNEANMNLAEVVRQSNLFEPNLHLALHSNASMSPLTQGCEVFCHTFTGEGYLFAKAIYKKVSDITPWADRGVKAGKDFYGKGKSIYELEKTNAPAVLIEIDFHTNKVSVDFIQKNIDKIANAIVSAIYETINEMKNQQVKFEIEVEEKGIDYEKKYKLLIQQMEMLIERYKG